LKQTTTLLLIRHGETAWNAEGRIQGHLDVPLSAKGVWQARRLAERLTAELADAANGARIAAVVASDLTRASATAEPLAALLDMPITHDARLRERHFGIFQGHTLAEIQERWPDEFAAWRQRDLDWAPPTGESAAQFIARVHAALAAIAQTYAGATVAVVAHGGALDVAYRTARALSWDAPREHPIQNASLNRVAISAPPLALSIERWGDAAHLEAARDEIAG
jgi:probable phosphoglycerate mutase